MAYETGTATNLADLMTKLDTFAVANGWTSDQLSTGTGQSALHKGSVYVSFRWNTGTPLVLGIYQALGYTGGNQPGQHPNDSGNGAVSSTNTVLDDERCVGDIGNGAFPSYFFFEQDSGPAYIHVVVEISTDVFRHFGFGNIEKFGDWTGGEYVYGQFKTTTGATSNNNTNLLDGLFLGGASRERSATLHCEGLPGQAGTSKWGDVSDNTTNPANDTAGNTRIMIHGGFRGGPIARHFGFLAPGSTSGFVPQYPIGLFYRDFTNSNAYFLGFQPDVRGINIRFFVPKEEVTIGSDVWVMFPASQKSTAATANASLYLGVAYKKVTA